VPPAQQLMPAVGPSRKMRIRIALLALAVLLAGCSNPPSVATQNAEGQSRNRYTKAWRDFPYDSSPENALAHIWRLGHDSSLEAVPKEACRWVAVVKRVGAVADYECFSFREGVIPDFELVRIQGAFPSGKHANTRELTKRLFSYHHANRLIGEVDQKFASKLATVDGLSAGFVWDTTQAHKVFTKWGSWSLISADPVSGKFTLITYREFP
jgi:hypothetical protein